MRILITGANGFIGRTLLKRLLAAGMNGVAVEQVVASDLALPPEDDPRVLGIKGSIAAPGTLERALAAPVDLVFHLASVPGGAAEKDPDLGRRVNLDATLRLLELLRRQRTSPRLVFASTVAVYGDPLPVRVDDATPAWPALSYGAHKLAAEIMIADAARRGWVQACSLRLPGVVARPEVGAGLVSGFMSRLLWQLRSGEPVVLPVSAAATAWWLSIQACIDCLLHAGALDTARLGPGRVLQAPALHLSMQDVVDALARAYGPRRHALVSYAVDPAVQRLFGAYPPLQTPLADKLGFRHDGSADVMVARATEHDRSTEAVHW